MTDRSYSDRDWAAAVIADDLYGEGRGHSTARHNRIASAAFATTFLAGHDLQQLVANRASDAAPRVGAKRTRP